MVSECSSQQHGLVHCTCVLYSFVCGQDPYQDRLHIHDTARAGVVEAGDDESMEVQVQQRGSPAPAAELEVSLREFTMSDAEAFMSWASDPRVVRFQRRDAYEHVDQARRYIADHVLPHPWYRAICVGAGAPLPVVGSISVKPGPTEDGRPFRASVGYRLARAHWGRGIATRAVRAAAAAVFAAWPWLLRLEAVADVDNPASQRVLEKAGFAREGVLRKYVLLKGRPRDMVMFSIVVETEQDNPDGL